MIELKYNNELSSLRRNTVEIREMFGDIFFNKSINNEISRKEFEEANDYLSEIVYGKEIAIALKNQNLEYINKLYRETIEKYKKDFSKDFDINSIGMMIVRPEIYDNKMDVINYLKKLKLEILYYRTGKLNFEQYWMLYNHGLTYQYTLNDFPTRTYNYINKNCCFIVVSGNPLEYNFESISDYLCSLKGSPGLLMPNTFRGDLCINSLKKFLNRDGTLKKEFNIFLDPICAYRKIVSGDVDQNKTDNHQIGTNYPMLFYAGQGIHIPNSCEIEKDINVIFSENELRKILK